jgi:transcription antitermination factor NusG
MRTEPLTVKPLNILERTYHWRALYLRSRQEKVVERDLLEDGFEVYLPKVKKLKQWSDRKKWVEEPLFPGYCFVHVSEKEYHQILTHYAVIKYVSFGGKPSVMRSYHIEGIKRILGENIDFRLTKRNFRKGEIVEIGVGPMTGCKGEVVKASGKKKLIIRLQDIGYSMVVNIPTAYIE